MDHVVGSQSWRGRCLLNARLAEARNVIVPATLDSVHRAAYLIPEERAKGRRV